MSETDLTARVAALEDVAKAAQIDEDAEAIVDAYAVEDWPRYEALLEKYEISGFAYDQVMECMDEQSANVRKPALASLRELGWEAPL